jgi:hypothetical protein
MLWVNSWCIIVHYRKQHWGVFHCLVLSELQEVTVGRIARGRLHMTEYVVLEDIIIQIPQIPDYPLLTLH